MATTYEPGLYYVSSSATEVRKLLGQNPSQVGLFENMPVLPPGRWAYYVVWSRATGRQGKTYTCNAASFKRWGGPTADQKWWRRVETKEVRYFPRLDMWIDGDEIVAQGFECYDCGGQAEQRFPASELREFLGRGRGEE